MKKQIAFCLIVSILATSSHVFAQVKTGLENVNTISLRNSGTIKNNNDVRGYYFFYESDKMDRSTSGYTLQLMDDNLNAAKPIKLTMDAKTVLLESSTNENALCFMFYNPANLSLDYSVYDNSGKQARQYSTQLEKKSLEYFGQYKNVGGQGWLVAADSSTFISVIPIRDGKKFSYTITGMRSDKKKQWVYTPGDDEQKATCTYIGATNNVAFFCLLKVDKAMSNKGHGFILGIDMNTGRKKFEISSEENEYKLWPTSAHNVADSQMVLVGSYYDKDDYLGKSNSLGYGFWVINEKGKIVREGYSSWEKDISKYLTADAKGRMNDQGVLHTQKVIALADGSFVVVTEGFRKIADAGKIVMAVATGSYSGFTSAQTTDLVLLKFNSEYSVTGAEVFKKTANKVAAPADFISTPLLGLYLAMTGGFDYEFTQVTPDKTAYVIGYTDYEKSEEIKGLVFHSIRYDNGFQSTDKISLKTDASAIKVYQAKPGFIMLTEYFKKTKKLELRMEKLN